MRTLIFSHDLTANVYLVDLVGECDSVNKSDLGEIFHTDRYPSPHYQNPATRCAQLGFTLSQL